jgi:hypothetical protein
LKTGKENATVRKRIREIDFLENSKKFPFDHSAALDFRGGVAIDHGKGDQTSLWKKSHKMYPSPFLSKLIYYFYRGKKPIGLLREFKKLLKFNGPKGEKFAPKLVTLSMKRHSIKF